MKKLMCLGLLWVGCTAIPAQTPDSSRTKNRSMTYGTDSVRSGNQTYQGGRGKSQGDTLPKPRKSNKEASSKSKSAK